jgi:hypothetical protein
MSRFAKVSIAAAAVVTAIASPMWAELWFEHRPALFGAFAGLIAAAFLLVGNRANLIWTGAALASIAGLVAPAAAWPLTFLMIARRDLGSFRWRAAAVIFAALVIGAVIGLDAIDFVTLTELATEKRIEAVNASALAALSVVRPDLWPFSGPSRYAGDAWTIGLVIAVGIGLVSAVAFGVVRPRAKLLAALSAAVLAPAFPALLGRPINAGSIAAAPAVAATVAYALARTAAAMRTAPSRAAWTVTGAVLVAAHFGLAAPRAIEHWRVYADPHAVWTARLVEPFGAFYRLDYAS